MQQFNLLQIDAGLRDDFVLQLYKESIDYQICLHKPMVKEKLDKWEEAMIKIGKWFNKMWVERSKTGVILIHQPWSEPHFTAVRLQPGQGVPMGTRVVQSPP